MSLISIIKSKLKPIYHYIFNNNNRIANNTGIHNGDNNNITAGEKPVNVLYAEYKDILLKAIELGRMGKLFVTPENVSLVATYNCNIRCIMCIGVKKNIHLTIDEVSQLLQVSEHKGTSYGKIKMIDFTSGESLLNPDLHLIVKYIKSSYPDVVIRTMTNGTFKIEGKIKEALENIDRIGISVDGATKGTFEFIRQGADFFKVLKNIQDIVKVKKDTTAMLSLAFVAMTINIHELPSWVRLAYYLDIKWLFVQKLEVREHVQPEMVKYMLSNMPREEIQEIINETKQEVEKLDRYLTLTELISDDTVATISNGTSNNTAADITSDPSNNALLNKTDRIQSALVVDTPDEQDDNIPMRMCKYLWKFSPWLPKDETGVYPELACCHMPHGELGDLSDKSHLRNTSLSEIYNSKEYWDLRTDLLSGKLAKAACAGCQYYKMELWTEDELKELADLIGNA